MSVDHIDNAKSRLSIKAAYLVLVLQASDIKRCPPQFFNSKLLLISGIATSANNGKVSSIPKTSNVEDILRSVLKDYTHSTDTDDNPENMPEKTDMRNRGSMADSDRLGSGQNRGGHPYALR
jgi:hypothetical protein